MYRECPHGVVAGTCCWCLAEALEYEQQAQKEICHAVAEREKLEAAARVRHQAAHQSSKG